MLIIAFLSLFSAKAEVINVEAARLKAMSFVANRTQTGKRAATRVVHDIKIAESSETFHVFNIGDTDGYVVVGGDDRMPDILGYSDNGCFDSRNIPDNMRAWLQDYERQYEYLKTHPETKLTTRGVDSREPITPMLECKWGQGFLIMTSVQKIVRQALLPQPWLKSCITTNGPNKPRNPFPRLFQRLMATKFHL